MRYILIILSLFVFNSILAQTFKGQVLDKVTHTPFKGAEIMLTVKVSSNDTGRMNFDYFLIALSDGRIDTVLNKKKKITQTVRSDDKGMFLFETFDSTASVKCFYKASHNNVIRYFYSDSIVRLNDKWFCYIDAVCKYDKTSQLKYCPNCKRKDKVKPILWGLPAANANGEFKIDLDKYYLGGCEYDPFCHPYKYCRRCNLEF